MRRGTQPRPWRTPLFPLSKRATLATTVALLVLLLLWLLDAKALLSEFLQFVDDLGWAGPPLFLVLHASAVVLLFPGMLFPLGAGFLYGPIAGTALSTLGKTLGAAASFFIARYLLDDPDPPGEQGRAGDVRHGGNDQRARRAARVQRFKRRHPKLQLLDRKLPEGGWRMVALIRLVPVIPFKLSNYFFGWSRFRRRDYLLGTLLGTIPYSFTNAWIGSLAADLSNLTADPLPRRPLEWALTLGALSLALAAAAMITRRARQILSQP